MSDTPRTDAVAYDITTGHPDIGGVVTGDFARELERENADFRAILDAVIAADERAVELWRASHPGKKFVIPDRGALVQWLLEQIK